jgi:hypothetical protein
MWEIDDAGIRTRKMVVPVNWIAWDGKTCCRATYFLLGCFKIVRRGV